MIHPNKYHPKIFSLCVLRKYAMHIKSIVDYAKRDKRAISSHDFIFFHPIPSTELMETFHVEYRKLFKIKIFSLYNFLQSFINNYKRLMKGMKVIARNKCLSTLTATLDLKNMEREIIH